MKVPDCWCNGTDGTGIYGTCGAPCSAVRGYYPRHPHEPQIPPALDAEGRCLVCALMAERDDLLRGQHQIRKTLDDACVPSIGFDVPTRVALLAWKVTR